MKPLLSPLLLALAVSLLLPPLLRAQLLSNPGFENGLEGWIVKEKTPITSVEADAAYEGKFGLRITDELPDGSANIATDRFPVTPGKKVTLGFMARSPTGPISAVMIVPYGSDNRPILDDKTRPVLSVGVKQSQDWSHYEAEYIVPEGVSAFSLSIRSWTTPTGVVELDNFELKVE